MLAQISGKEFPRLLHRYSKLSDGQLDQIETIADAYLSGTVKSSALPLIGGVGIGLYIGAVSLPIVGAIAGSSLIYGAILNAIQKGRNAEYIKDSGLLAPFLKERELIAYADVVGVEAISSEIEQAYQEGQKVSSAARRFMRQMGQPLQRRTIARYVESLQTDPAPPTSRPTIQTPVQQRSQPVYRPAGYFDPATGKGSIVLDLVVQSPGISRLMIGGQRTGKSYFAAVASRELAQQGWQIFHINLASYGAEDDYYWRHAYKSVKGDLASITDSNQAIDLIASAIDLVNEFITTEGAILIVDEIVFAGSKYGKWDTSAFLRIVAEQISALTSSGMKRERAIWALCPELVAGSMKDAVKAIKSLNLLYVAITPEMSVQWGSQTIKFDKSVHQQVTANFKGVEMPTAEQVSLCRRHNLPRIAYLNGEWLPLGELAKIAAPTIAQPSAPGIYAPASPFRDAADVLLEPYLKVDSAPMIPQVNIEAELPELYEAIARMTISQTFEQPGTIRNDGTKADLTRKGDAIEVAILEFLKSRSDGATVGRMRADKYALKPLAIEELEEYLLVLVAEGKIGRDGNVYYLV
jgi:hypothetical protein